MFTLQNDLKFGEALVAYLVAQGVVDDPSDVMRPEVVRIPAYAGTPGEYDDRPAENYIAYQRHSELGWQRHDIPDSVDEFLYDLIRVVLLGGQ